MAAMQMEKVRSILENKEAANLILDLASEEGLKIVRFLAERGKTDEFTLAGKTGFQINYARSLLYKLYNKKLVTFSRQRDAKKGWYIYSWEFDPNALVYEVRKSKMRMLIELRETLDKERNIQLFECPGCNSRFPFTRALERTFKCVCGMNLKAVDKTVKLRELQHRIGEVEKEIKQIGVN